MAVQRRSYIFVTFFISLVNVLLILVAIASNNWVVSSATGVQVESSINYGLFRGDMLITVLATPTAAVLYMTCLPDINACAVSCKTESEARRQEVEALALGYRPNTACVTVTEVNTSDPLETPPVISFAVYVSLLVMLFLTLICALISGGLAILNAVSNPTEPVFGLPGCLWSNVTTSVLGFISLMIFGVYWASSGLKEHLAFSYVALVDNIEQTPGIGYSYWLFFVAVILSLCNVGLIELRRYLLERDPPPPTLKVDNHSDGTIFLY